MGKFEDEKFKSYGDHTWAWFRIPARDFINLDEKQRNILCASVYATNAGSERWGDTPYDVPHDKMRVISLSQGSDHKWGDISHLDRFTTSAEIMEVESLRIGKLYVKEEEEPILYMPGYWRNKIGV